MSLSYFQVTYSTDRDVVGTIPQIDSTCSGLKRKVIRELEDITMHPFEFPANIPTLDELELEPDAYRTDMLHTSYLSNLNGILISPEIRSIFEKCMLANGRFYKATVYDQKCTKHPYYFYFYLASPELINYSGSRFEITDIIDNGEGEALKLTSFQDQVSRKREIGAGKSIRPRRIKLTTRSDLFKLPMTGQLFMSNSLKQELSSANITGMATKPSSIEFVE